jgi:8-oxo-dGTP pyrophosphatase MutT (NUDIX family)
LRDIKLTGKPKPLLVSTERTWQDISRFHQKQLEFVAVEPGKDHVLRIGQTEIGVAVLDASDHWRGGVNFIISAGNFRFGALFDRKTWAGVGNAAENLDLAVIEANSIYPMSDKTGHTSLAEALAFLRTLSVPPRLSLLTHMGHDDTEQLSMGSLAALIHGLAPNNAINWAYPGMRVSAKHLPPRNPVAILDEQTNMVVGVGEKSVVHAGGRLHGSVLILVRTSEGRIALYRRHAEQSYPLCLDAFGGHYAPADAPDPRNTALREASEEIKLTKDGVSVHCDPGWLMPLSGPFELESLNVRNRERSTLFGIQLPAGVSVEAAGDETDDGRRVCGTVEALSLPEFLTLRDTTANSMADGLARVMAALRDNEGIRQRVDIFLNGGKA